MSTPRILEDISEQPEVLRRLGTVNASALSQARQVLAGCRVVRLAGIGSSRHAAGIGAAALEVVAHLPATVLAAPGAGVPLPLLDSRDVLVVVSQSGETHALLAVVKAARSQRVTTIAVVNSVASTLGAAADMVIACTAGDERVVAATKTVTAQALAIRLLAGDVSGKQLDAFVAAVATVVDMNDLDIEALLPRESPRTIVCSSLAAQWEADEIALKFAEIAGWTVAAESIVDYLHGPVATGEVTLALLRGDDVNAPALSRCEHVHMIDLDHVVPSCGDACLDAIAGVVLGQRLAVAWARRQGEDPDASRGLSKVTRTR